jgi:hypothetical protein
MNFNFWESVATSGETREHNHTHQEKPGFDKKAIFTTD